MKIRIIAVGKLKASPFHDLCAEYIKRMNWTVKLVEVDAPKASTSAQEAPLILKQIPEKAIVIALDERGVTLTSPEFSAKIAKWGQTAPEVVFLIGGADGFHETVREKAKYLLSFGKQTWPHMMVRVMLLEQIYRAQQIIAGHPYHRT